MKYLLQILATLLIASAFHQVELESPMDRT